MRLSSLRLRLTRTGRLVLIRAGRILLTRTRRILLTRTRRPTPRLPSIRVRTNRLKQRLHNALRQLLHVALVLAVHIAIRERHAQHHLQFLRPVSMRTRRMWRSIRRGRITRNGGRRPRWGRWRRHRVNHAEDTVERRHEHRVVPHVAVQHVQLVVIANTPHPTWLDVNALFVFVDYTSFTMQTRT